MLIYQFLHLISYFAPYLLLEFTETLHQNIICTLAFYYYLFDYFIHFLKKIVLVLFSFILKACYIEWLCSFFLHFIVTFTVSFYFSLDCNSVKKYCFFLCCMLIWIASHQYSQHLASHRIPNGMSNGSFKKNLTDDDSSKNKFVYYHIQS